MKYRAFTLVELLVVIAIIAILASLLFPVFARAKEAAQRTDALMGLRQLNASCQLYLADNDDMFPSAYGVSRNGRVWWEYAVSIPNGWAFPFFEPDDGQSWANSLQPYRRSYEPIAAAGMPKFRVSGAPYDYPAKPWQEATHGMNGLLSVYPASSVADPSHLTAFWPEEGKVRVEGWAYANPALICNGGWGQTCRFNPSGPAQPSGRPGPNGIGDFWFPAWSPEFDTAWLYNKGMPIAFADGSVKHLLFNPSGKVHQPGEMERNYRDPAMTYETGGRQASGHRCQSAEANVRYLSFFRPDSTFAYDFGSSPQTRCNR